MFKVFIAKPPRGSEKRRKGGREIAEELYPVVGDPAAGTVGRHAGDVLLVRLLLFELLAAPMLMIGMSSSPVGPSSRPGGSLPAIAPAFGT